jgi:hypothetical protein
VLVRDPVQQLLGQLPRGLDQRAGEGGHRPGERHLLGAGGLVAPVEQPVQQVRAGLEHVPVEPARDLGDVVDDGRQRRLHHRAGSIGEHG